MSAGRNDPQAPLPDVTLSIGRSPSGEIKCGDPALSLTCGPVDPRGARQASATWHRFRDEYCEHFASLAGKDGHGLEAAFLKMRNVSSYFIRQQYVKSRNKSNDREKFDVEDNEHKPPNWHIFQ